MLRRGAADEDRVRVLDVLPRRHRGVFRDVAETTPLRHVTHHCRQLPVAHPDRRHRRHRRNRPATMLLSLLGQSALANRTLSSTTSSITRNTWHSLASVSYTHLTLPTILRV